MYSLIMQCVVATWDNHRLSASELLDQFGIGLSPLLKGTFTDVRGKCHIQSILHIMGRQSPSRAIAQVSKQVKVMRAEHASSHCLYGRWVNHEAVNCPFLYNSQ